MVRFSQRYGHKPIRDIVQIDDMDRPLRTSLWNVFHSTYAANASQVRRIQGLFRSIWADFLFRPLDALPDTLHAYPSRCRRVSEDFKEIFFKGPWHEVYDLVEFIAQTDPISAKFTTQINEVLRRQKSGYRVIDCHVVPITDDIETDAINQALSDRQSAVADQLNRALELLSDRETPDYRNSIKESISAVETQARAALGTDKGTLGALLIQFEHQHPIHPAMKEAFSKLYGYTSDEGGIRHALMDDSREATFEEAKFMLVACSAFINYVRGISAA